MITPQNNSTVTLVTKPQFKKHWDKPALFLIARDNVNAKIHPSILENTGSAFTHSGNQYFTNNASLSFKGTKYEAAS